MNLINATRVSILLLLAFLALMIQGCSELEPRHGTKVTIAFRSGKPVTRDRLLTLSRYLTAKGRLVLGVRNPRVDEVRESFVVLLLPGKKISADKVSRLVEPSSIDLYHLKQVATKTSPNRPWKLAVPSTAKGPYLFLGPNAQRIDSQRDADALLTDVVGHPDSKPIITGQDILPNAFARQAGQGWGVQVKFNTKGAKTLLDFTRRNRGECLAVFYNGRLLSAPIIREAIPGGAALITGFRSANKAEQAVAEINAGTLPASVRITRVEYY